MLGSVVMLGALGAFTAVLWEARAMLLHDPRLVIASSSSIQITGNNHLTRPQLLSVFGEDVDRNLLTVSLSERRQELESLPWVEHADEAVYALHVGSGCGFGVGTHLKEIERG